MGTQRPPISETELEVLKVLWEHGPGTVRELNEHLVLKRRRWAYTTVQTLLNRLKEKGYVARDESALAHVFRAAVTRDKLVGFRLREIADQICGGEATPLVASLAQRNDLTGDDIKALRKMLDDLEAEGAKKTRRKKR